MDFDSNIQMDAKTVAGPKDRTSKSFRIALAVFVFLYFCTIVHNLILSSQTVNGPNDSMFTCLHVSDLLTLGQETVWGG